MNETLWTKVDDYLGSRLLPKDPVLERALAFNVSSGLPAIDVSPLQGKFLHLLAKLTGARRILEIGTLGGYSTICLARALGDGGHVISLELEEKHALVARKNIKDAGLTGRVEILVGAAMDSLLQLKAEKGEPFDFVFIDADKVNTRAYFECAVSVCRPGAVIVADNVVRKGEVANAASTDASVIGMRQFVEALAHDSRVEASGIQTVGTKGYDGFILIRVR